MTPHRNLIEPTREAAGHMGATLTSIPHLNLGLAVSGAAAAVAGVLGAGATELLGWLLVLMLVDLAAGLVRALRLPGERVSGAKFLGGFLGKLSYLMLLPVAVAVEKVVLTTGLGLPGEHPVALIVVGALIMKEGASIAENVQGGERKRLLAADALVRLIRAWSEEVHEPTTIILGERPEDSVDMTEDADEDSPTTPQEAS